MPALYPGQAFGPPVALSNAPCFSHRSPSLHQPIFEPHPQIMSATRPRVLNFITSNRNKLAEATVILRGCVELRSQSVDVLEIQGTPRDIAADKCRRAAIAVRHFFSFFMPHREAQWEALLTVLHG